jgi:hypothetical protein
VGDINAPSYLTGSQNSLIFMIGLYQDQGQILEKIVPCEWFGWVYQENSNCTENDLQLLNVTVHKVA